MPITIDRGLINLCENDIEDEYSTKTKVWVEANGNLIDVLKEEEILLSSNEDFSYCYQRHCWYEQYIGSWYN